MTVALERKKRITTKEYLALEELAPFKSEYYQGESFVMAGGSFNHEMIAGNFFREFDQFTESASESTPDKPRSCTAFTSNMKLLVQAHNLYTYPDAMLICGKPEFEKNRTDTVLNPLIIVEVLSHSTQSYDQGKKFEFYQALPTMQEYLLVDQYRVHIQLYRKLEDGRWELTILRHLEAMLTLPSIDLKISLRRLYRRVDWLANTPHALKRLR
jgi:Uma2 family endonuclease